MLGEYQRTLLNRAIAAHFASTVYVDGRVGGAKFKSYAASTDILHKAPPPLP